MSKCPICRGMIPNNQNPGAYPGALSRFDNHTEVCSMCGSVEALIGLMGSDDAKKKIQVSRTFPPKEWPQRHASYMPSSSSISMMSSAMPSSDVSSHHGD